MAQIVVRNLDEHVMQGLKALAAQPGISAEQAVRSLIADAVDTEARRQSFRHAAGQLRARLRETHGTLCDSIELIRSDRDR